jgi:hypothetical protein
MTVIIGNVVDDLVDWEALLLGYSFVVGENGSGDLVDWEFMTRGGVELDNEIASSIWPYPLPGGVLAAYRNKCVDTVTLQWIEWVTDYQDVYGTEYPGAGFDPGTYRVINITYDQGQG